MPGSPSFFDYDLPKHLIAQHPCARRDQSRLLVVDRASGELHHRVFADLPELLQPGDLLILNDTRVLPARLLGRRTRTGGKWEGLVLRSFADGSWELMCQTRGRLLPGETIALDPGPLELRLIDKMADGHWRAQPGERGDLRTLLDRHGHVPLPPYIRKGQGEPGDRERYQTLYARAAGAVAAPTAGLHFTAEVFARLVARGIERAFVTLHVGPGTFQPIAVDNFTQQRMHAEWGELTETTVAAIAACKARGGRVVAVGTTCVRVLESASITPLPSGERGRGEGEDLRPWSGETDLFIYPPYHFRAVDAMVTNFHLPRSTLLLLVAAFAGVELLEKAYRAAIEAEYRFYSYGDAMLVV